MNTWPKKCGYCGRCYSFSEWTGLQFVAYWIGGERWEQRECGCGVTLSIQVERYGTPHTTASKLVDLCVDEAFSPDADVRTIVRLAESARRMQAIVDRALALGVVAVDRAEAA